MGSAAAAITCVAAALLPPQPPLLLAMLAMSLAAVAAPVPHCWLLAQAPYRWLRALTAAPLPPPPLCRFQILNMRQPVQFVYLRGGWFNTNEVVAVSPLITFRHGRTCGVQRVAACHEGTDMRVWVCPAGFAKHSCQLQRASGS